MIVKCWKYMRCRVDPPHWKQHLAAFSFKILLLHSIILNGRRTYNKMSHKFEKKTQATVDGENWFQQRKNGSVLASRQAAFSLCLRICQGKLNMQDLAWKPWLPTVMHPSPLLFLWHLSQTFNLFMVLPWGCEREREGDRGPFAISVSTTCSCLLQDCWDYIT